MNSNEYKKIFGRRWAGPEVFEHAVNTPVAYYPKVGGDGQPCTVYLQEWPAVFASVKVEASENSIGTLKSAFTLSFGSGLKMVKLADTIAKGIADGMIGCYMEVNK